jgi:hypothetical protein
MILEIITITLVSGVVAFALSLQCRHPIHDNDNDSLLFY